MNAASRPQELAVDRPNRYAATVHHVHDGDTPYCLAFDPFVGMYLLTGVRVRGVQAPELKDPGGPEVRDAVAQLAPAGLRAVVSDMTPDPYRGRVVAHITLADGTDLAQWLLDRGYAVPWDGTGTKPVVPWPPVAPPAGTVRPAVWRAP